MTIVSVLLKTGSGDDYLFIDDATSILAKISKSMGEEINYVWYHEIVSHPHSPEINDQVREQLYVWSHK